jgi:hypothetical protein
MQGRSSIIAAALAAAAFLTACKGGLGDPCEWHDDCGSRYVCHRTEAEISSDSPGRCVDGLTQAKEALDAISEIRKRCDMLHAEAEKTGKGPHRPSTIYGNPEKDPRYVYENMGDNRVFGYAMVTCDPNSMSSDCSRDTLELMEIIIKAMIKGDTFSHKIMIGEGI